MTCRSPSILLSPRDEEKLAMGEALMQAVVREDGISRRLIMVRDIKAPDAIVSDRFAPEPKRVMLAVSTSWAHIRAAPVRPRCYVSSPSRSGCS